MKLTTGEREAIGERCRATLAARRQVSRTPEESRAWADGWRATFAALPEGAPPEGLQRRPGAFRIARQLGVSGFASDGGGRPIDARLVTMHLEAQGLDPEDPGAGQRVRSALESTLAACSPCRSGAHGSQCRGTGRRRRCDLRVVQDRARSRAEMLFKAAGG